MSWFLQLEILGRCLGRSWPPGWGDSGPHNWRIRPSYEISRPNTIPIDSFKGRLVTNPDALKRTLWIELGPSESDRNPNRSQIKTERQLYSSRSIKSTMRSFNNKEATRSSAADLHAFNLTWCGQAIVHERDSMRSLLEAGRMAVSYSTKTPSPLFIRYIAPRAPYNPYARR